MRLVFCGTPEFAVPCLEAVVAAGHSVELVLAQPDRSQGRGMKLTMPPVKLAAERYAIPVMQPEKIRSNVELQQRLRELALDLIVVVAYGRILPQWMLDLPRYGCVNVHASLLPAYRGAAPIQWALARGESITGVTTMQMDAGLDTGDMLMQREIAIRPEWRAPELSSELSRLGSELLGETLGQIESGKARPCKQDNAAATLAPLLSREDARVDWQSSAREIHNRWRGFFPWPGCSTLFRGEALQLKRVCVAEDAGGNAAGPGVCEVREDRWLVACGIGTLEILGAQTAGKRTLTAQEFIAAHKPVTGERLG